MSSSVSVIVTRGAGDKSMELVDPLVTSEDVAILTGTTIIDREYSSRILVEVACAPGAHMQPGALVEVIDGELGSYRARLVRVVREYARTNDGFQATMTLTLEKDSEA